MVEGGNELDDVDVVSSREEDNLALRHTSECEFSSKGNQGKINMI